MIELRPFQLEAQTDLKHSYAAGNRRLLLQAATGAGKTVIAAEIIKHATSNGHHALFLAHRREIVWQTEKKLESFGVTAGIIQSGEPWNPTCMVNVASIQTLHSWCVRRKRAAFPKAAIVFIDEAHHYNSSKTWQDVVSAYPEAVIVGMTATPISRKGKGLGLFFDEMIRCPSVTKLTEMGYLVPARYWCPNSKDLANLKNIKVVAGDYVEKQLEEMMNVPKLVGDIPENWSRICPDRQTLVFASGVKHSLALKEAFQKINVSVAHVDANTPGEERDQIVRDFNNGKIKVLCNCAIFTEGTDLPIASALVFARPTKSLLLYLQVAGRVLRPFPGKENCYVLDHAGVVFQHGPIDQDWDWRLDYGSGDIRTETAKITKLKRQIDCGNCGEVYFGRLDCPGCGWKITIKGRHIENYPGYLQALDEIENPPAISEQVFYQQLLGYAMEKGKSTGSAHYRFIEKFGHKASWSWKNLPPLTPGVEVRAFVAKTTRTYFWKQKNPHLANLGR